MAFYTGCLDERFKVILASDFGIGWDQTNWKDLWYWGSRVDELKAANPSAAANANLFTGTFLDVPVPADSAAGKAAMAAEQEAAVEARGTVHVVKKGETLGVIARKYKITLKQLYSLNNLTEKDARRIQPGRELKVGE